MSKNENSQPSPETDENPLEADDLSPEQIEDLKIRAAKAEENWNRLLHTTADFDNFKKRAAREKIESAQYATASLLQKILPILDNFEMALVAVKSGHDGKSGALQSGVLMIQQQLKNVLTESGLEEIDATGQVFDPALHEAISQQESEDVPEGNVLLQTRKGYKLKERLLRPAAVIVAKKPSDNSK